MLSVYVTGTDTGVGKTRASVALLDSIRAHGLRAAGMKPVASGCTRIDGEWRNDDALALLAASDPEPSYYDVNPYALPDPTAPEIPPPPPASKSTWPRCASPTPASRHRPT
jgi:dethiobiotin synthetase